MRRDFRKKRQTDKIIIYSVSGVLILTTIVLALLIYGDSLNKDSKNGGLSSDKIASIVENEVNLESASSNIGKSVEDSKNETKENNENHENEINTINSNRTEKTNTIDNTKNTNNVQSNTQTTSVVSNSKVESKTNNTHVRKQLEFQMPIEGEIVREFAKENLIYSDTLQEWVTHTGIDIKAEKTEVVQAAEDGTVKSIKNDPRYGLTIVIEHNDGYESVYANLLSSEFVSEGEKVIKGQSIGTVGNTAAFESVDEPHLHFEIIKDSIQVDPNLYLK